MSKNDLYRLKLAFRMEERDFINRFCRIVVVDGKKRVSLKEKSNYDCIFWENGICEVYEARPFQCRSFPFWNNILRTKESWDAHKLGCPGMGSGTFYSREEIDHRIALAHEEDYRYIPEEVE